MKTLSTITLVILLSGCASLGFEDEQEIELSMVPENIMQAAVTAVPGIVITEAEIETDEDGNRIYELDGELDGIEYEIEISEDGEILEIENSEDSEE